MMLQLPRPFNVDWALAHLRTSSYGTPYRFEGPCRLRRVLPVDGRPAAVEFDFCHTAGQLAVRIVGGIGPSDGRSEGACAASPGLRSLSALIWGLDDDLSDCRAVLGGDPHLGPLMQRYAGLRVVRAPNLYETLLVAVLGQQVSVASAQAVRRRLMAELGDRVTADGQEYSGYPPPERLLEAGPDGLRALGASRQKARYLLEVAQRAVAGELGRAAFAGLSDEAAVARLCEIPGVGRWTAEVALMRGLGRPDAFPAADVGLMVAAQRLLGLSHRPTESELRMVAERWQGWRSYAAFYLWMTLMDGVYA